MQLTDHTASAGIIDNATIREISVCNDLRRHGRDNRPLDGWTVLCMVDIVQPSRSTDRASRFDDRLSQASLVFDERCSTLSYIQATGIIPLNHVIWLQHI